MGKPTKPHLRPGPRSAARDDGHRPAAPGGVELEIRDPREVRPDVLETFPYEYPGSPATVEISTDEFTAVCPWSGLPDFGRLDDTTLAATLNFVVFDLDHAPASVKPLDAGELTAERAHAVDGAAVREHRKSLAPPTP